MAGAREFKFDSKKEGRAKWTLETDLTLEEVGVIIDEVRKMVSELRDDGHGDLVFESGSESIRLSRTVNPDRHLGYSEDDGSEIIGMDIKIDVTYPCVYSISDKTNAIVMRIAEAIFHAIDTLSLRGKVPNSKGF